MTKTLYLQIYIQIRPANSIATFQSYIQNITNGSIFHPRYSIIRKKIIISFHTNHNTLGINH